MLSSFYSGASGLRNHQQAMDVIGNNIANVNTVGFKSSQVTFTDTLSQTLEGGRQASATTGGQNPSQVGLGMTVGSISQNFSQGALETTGNGMDLAIQGKGFFVVGQENNYFYTRAGSLAVDDDSNLVTNTGDRVYGWVDTNKDGIVDVKSDQMQWINLDRNGDGTITNVLSSVTPAVQGPNKGDSSLGTITTLPSTITDDWKVEVVDAANGLYQVVGTKTGVLVNDAATSGDGTTTSAGEVFSNPKIGTFVLNAGIPQQAGLSVSYDDNNDGTTDAAIQYTAANYGAGGNDVQVEVVNAGRNKSLGVTVVGNTITVTLATDDNGQPISTRQQVVDAINQQAGDLVQADLLDGSGAALDPASSAAQAVAATMSSRYLQGGSGADLGDYFTFKSTAPGGSALQTMTISSDGTVLGVFDNGTTEQLARVALSVIPNPQGMLSVGDGKYAESPTSGSGFPPVVAGTEGSGTLAAGFLEMSNVDLSQEFTNMIVVERGFQANSRVITTSDEMLQDLLALKR